MKIPRLTLFVLVAAILASPALAEVCIESVAGLPASCNGGIIEVDTFSGSCRSIVCTNDPDSMWVLACDKPDTGEKQYFEMYKQIHTGDSVQEVCIGETCISDTGFVSSVEQFPFCYEPETGTLTLFKEVINDDGDAAGPEDFVLLVNDTQLSSGDSLILEPGTYTVGEGAYEGYELLSITGDCDENGSVTLEAGDEKTCTLTNDDIPGEACVEGSICDIPATCSDGEVSNEQCSGACRSFSCGTIDILACAKPNDGEKEYFEMYRRGPTDDDTPATVCLADTCMTPGYGFAQSADFPICAPVAPVTATITIMKNVVNDNGGSKTTNDFNFTLRLLNDSCEVPHECVLEEYEVVHGETREFAPGMYEIVESTLLPPPHYGSQYDGPLFGEDCGMTPQYMILTSTEQKTCTVTNDDKVSKLYLGKFITNDNGGDLSLEDVELWLDLPDGSTVPVTVNEELTLYGDMMDAGRYRFYETPTEGYNATYGGICANVFDNQNGTFWLENGALAFSCTITNDDIAPNITINKVVINDDGGMLNASDFAPELLDENATDIHGGAFGDVVTVSVGTYTVGETGGLAGSFTSSFSGDCDENGTITVALNEEKTCTITNNDIPSDFGDAPDTYGTLLANNGAWHTVGGGWLGSALDVQEIDGQPTAGADGDDTTNLDDEDGVVIPTLISGTAQPIEVTVTGVGSLNAWIDFNANGNFADVGEQVITDAAVSNGLKIFNVSTPADAAEGTTYARFRISTAGGDSYEGFAAGGEVEDYVVDITGGIENGTITVNKILITDDGQNHTVDDFLWNVWLNGSPFITQKTFGSTVSLAPGTYGLFEGSYGNILPLYNRTLSGDCSAIDNSFTIVSGQNLSCTYTNDDLPQEPVNTTNGTVTAHKVLINDDGGDKTEAFFGWRLKYQNTSGVFPNPLAWNDVVSIAPGIYSVSEVFFGPGGNSYEQTINCDGDNIFTLAPGSLVNCTFTNDDIPGEFPFCGNNIIESGEECDGTDLGSATCESQGFAPGGGSLSCAGCVYETSGCFTEICGNGIVEGGEECEDTATASCPEDGIAMCTGCVNDLSGCFPFPE